MVKKAKRWIAGALTVLMVGGLLPHYVLNAEEPAAETEEITEEAVVEETAVEETVIEETVEEEPAVVEETAEETVVEETVEEEAEEGIVGETVEEPVAEVPAEETVTEEPAQPVEETVVEEETVEEAETVEGANATSAVVRGYKWWYGTYFSADLRDYSVEVSGSTSAFGNAHFMRVQLIEDDGLAAAVNSEYQELTDYKAFSVEFLDKKGRPVQLKGKVDVDVTANVNGTEYAWYLNDNGSWRKASDSLRISGAVSIAKVALNGIVKLEDMEVGGTGVSIDAAPGVFPVGTTVAVEAAKENKDVIAAVDALEGDYEIVDAVDITFDHDGEEVQPADGKTVAVEIAASADLEEGTEYKVVHIGANGAEELDAAKVVFDYENNKVTFEADSFSVYAIIGRAIIVDEEGSFEFETDEYKITVSYTKEAKIPAGTELIVSQIQYDSDEYWDLWEKSLAKLNENATWGNELEPSTRKGIASAVFFDVSLMNGDVPFEPEIPLQVEIELKHGGLPLFEGQEVEIIHFGKAKTRKSDGTELIDDVAFDKGDALSNGMPKGVSVDSFKYEQTGFSPVGIITTDDPIDFEAAEHAGSYSDIDSLTSRLMLAGTKLAGTRAAGDPTINAGKTVTDNDGDGIYELALSVNATSQQSSETKATKSNVVMVIDVSGSMGNEQSYVYYDTYTYDASTYNNFRYYTSSASTSTRLYYGQYRTGGYGSQVRTGWYSGGNTYGGQVYYATAYSGTVYAYETRLHATQRAACAVVDALLEKNNNPDGITDLFEITVVKFANQTATGNYNGTETIIKDSTSATAIKNAINALTSGGGTNWEAALNLALTEANYFKNTDPSRSTDPEEITSVIFLTDGFPTYYVNNNGSQGGTGGESADNIATSYTEARPSARNIVSAGFNLYNIFAFGSDTTTYNNHTGFAYLRALTNYAYGSGNNDNYNETTVTRQYAFNAKSTDDLVNAFATIINHITNNVGYAGVNLSDGVSLGATSTSVAVNGTAKAETMRYTVKDASDKLSYTVTINSSGAATFTIYNPDGTTTTLTDSTPETVSTTINGTTIQSQVYSVTVGTGENAKTYKMSPATINADNGMVKWDLAGLGILESGYTYTVAFDVWPNQLAYDIAADLNNGIYSSVDEALDDYSVTDATERQHIKDAIVHNADGSYSLYTNYSQDIEYYPATSHTDDEGVTTWEYGEKQTQELPQPDPIPLKGSLLPLAKVWESDLALAELNELLWKDGVVGGTSNEYQITLYVWKADTEAALEALIAGGDTSKAYITEVLGWDAATNSYIFQKDAAVAPGTMVNLDEAAELGFDITDTSKIKIFTNDEGTTLEYYVIESGHYYYVTEDGSDLHFELETQLYHPMIVDGTLYNIYFGEGQTVEKMDPMYAVIATNKLKGGLNISKVVSTTVIEVTDGEITNVTEPVDEQGVKTVTDEFTYEITIWKVDDSGNESPVYTYDDQIDTAGNKTKSGSIGYRIMSEPQIVDEVLEYGTVARGAILPESSPYASLANGIYAVIEGTRTKLTLTMPANGEIRLVNLPSGTHYTVKEIVEDGAGYTYAATKSQVKKSETEITDGTVTTDNTVSGTIAGNSAAVETYYNWAANFYVYHSSDNTVEKISFADSRVEVSFDEAKKEYIYSFSIVNETKAGHIYGGYYKGYAGASMSDDEIIAAEYKNSDDKSYTYITKTEATENWMTDSGSPYVGDQTSWNGDPNAEDGVYTAENGTAMNPAVNTVYYLKEVPESYLLPTQFEVFDIPTKNLYDFYLLTATDDANYWKVGFTYGTEDYEAELYKYVDVEYQAPVIEGDDTKIKKINIGDISGANTSGYIAMAKQKTPAFGTKNMMPYFITPDGVQVTGVKYRSVIIKDTNGDSVIQSGNGTESEIKYKDRARKSKIDVVTAEYIKALAVKHKDEEENG